MSGRMCACVLVCACVCVRRLLAQSKPSLLVQIAKANIRLLEHEARSSVSPESDSPESETRH